MDSALLSTIQRLLHQAPKPVPASKQRLAHIPDPYVTLKLDGVRTLLVCAGDAVLAYTIRGQERIDLGANDLPNPLPPLSIFDTERIGSHFYVFDVLFVKGVDVRHLPTLARLRETKTLLPACAMLKRLYWGPTPSIPDTVCRLMRSQPKLADGSRMETIEGFIFGSLAAPYQQEHLKFKFAVTCDFQVESVHDATRACASSSVRCLRLYIQRMQDIVAFSGQAHAPGVAILDAATTKRLGLSEGYIGLADNVILEMRLVTRHWEVVRQRRDRLRPNTLRTVLENIELCHSKHSDILTILSSISCEVHHTRAIDHVSSAMLRAVGTCGAIASIKNVNALFLPDCANLTLELNNDTSEACNIAIVTILVKSAHLLPAIKGGATLPASSTLVLEEVVARAKDKGWRCKALCSIRACDFLVGNCVLPEGVERDLGNAIFLILSRDYAAVGID